MAPKQTQILKYLIQFNVSTQSFFTNTCHTIIPIHTIHANLYLPHYHHENSNFRQFSSPSQSSFYRLKNSPITSETLTTTLPCKKTGHFIRYIAPIQRFNIVEEQSTIEISYESKQNIERRLSI